MAGINGKRSTYCMQGQEQAIGSWLLALGQTKTNGNTIPSVFLRLLRGKGFFSSLGGRP